MFDKLVICPLLLLLLAAAPRMVTAQSAQVGADIRAPSARKLSIEYVSYRGARCETKLVKEADNDPPNRGGIVCAYLRNNTERPVELKFWRLNGRDESYWRVDRRAVWDRSSRKDLAPGEMCVVEINGVSEEFAAGQPFNFAYVDKSYIGAGYIKTTLAEDPVQVSYIRVLPGMRELEVFVRHTGGGNIELGGIEVIGKPVAGTEWSQPSIAGSGISIARVTLADALPPSELAIVKVAIKDAGADRSIYAHRRALEDYFPIGTWGADEDLRDELHALHIDTCVMGGKKSDSFFARDAGRLGMKAMVHTGVVTRVDQVRELAGSPHVACWMIQDEPDWSIPAQQILLADTTLREYGGNIPTFVTLCRNARFFEYAPIADIPCMDHYSVTAPSTSTWPRPWGTRLEETAYYTRDLKAASEPKPIWIWSQGLADWGERPKRPVPTPSELGAQLVLNLSRGAKGILWFSYSHKRGEQYPDVREAMRGWGRVLSVLRDEILGSEPAPYAIQAPEKIDAQLLVSRDAAILCVTNLEYEIDPEAYPFTNRDNVTIATPLPAWLRPAAALRLDAERIAPIAVQSDGATARLQFDTLRDTAVVLLANRPERVDAVRAQWAALQQSGNAAGQ